MVQCDLYAAAVREWGKEHQMNVTMEEMAEATAKISQFINRGRDVEDELVEELADVCIMMEQMRVIYGDRLTQAIYKKLNKLEAHLNERNSGH
jgi:NTP pyrophosphatase (non-canonical NTP hydrolase)